MKRWALVLLLAVAWPARAGDLPSGDPRELGFDPDGLAKIQALLEDAVKNKQVAGGAVLIARKGKVAARVAVGQSDVEAGTKLSPDAIFRIASMSKPVTSVAVMILVDEGKIGLDDPLSKYLPEFERMTVLAPRGEDQGVNPAATVPATRPITIKHLLTHTSGLSYRFMNKPVLGPLYVEAGVSDGLHETPGTIGDNVRRLARLPLLFEPGTTWDYSLATDVLGRVVEVASGRTLAEFFRERIFTPLKMEDTAFYLPEAKRPRLVTLYEPAGDDHAIRRVGLQPIQEGPLVYSAGFPAWAYGGYYSGGAGLASTIGDYARFLQMLLNGGELDGVRVLKPETVAQMTRNQIGDARVPFSGHGTGFGFGFGVRTDDASDADPAAVGSYSWGGFFYTYFCVDPRHELVALMFTNIYPNGHLRLREDVKRFTYESLK